LTINKEVYWTLTQQATITDRVTGVVAVQSPRPLHFTSRDA